MEKTKETPVNYDSELVERLKALYDGGNGKTVAEIAAEIDRTPKSVLGKLVHLGVYVKPEPKAAKSFADQGPSKKDILAILEKQGFSADALKGLGNATKPALQEVADRVANAA